MLTYQFSLCSHLPVDLLRVAELLASTLMAFFPCSTVVKVFSCIGKLTSSGFEIMKTLQLSSYRYIYQRIIRNTKSVQCTVTIPSFLKHSGRHVVRCQIVAGTDAAFTHTTCSWINCYRWDTITYHICFDNTFIIRIPQFDLIGKHKHRWVFHRNDHFEA